MSPARLDVFARAKDIRALAAELETCEEKLKTVNRLRSELEGAEAQLAVLEKQGEASTKTADGCRAKLPALKAIFDERHTAPISDAATGDGQRWCRFDRRTTIPDFQFPDYRLAASRTWES